MTFQYRCPRFIREMLDSIEGDERFVMTVGAGFVDSILLACGFLSGGEYVTLTLGTVGIYIGARGAVEVATTNAQARAAVAQAGGAPDVSPPDPPPPGQQVQVNVQTPAP